MSVGAGSIKRAANTAGSKANEEMAAKSETIQRAENRLAARKAGVKYVEPKTPAKSKTEGGKTQEAKAAEAKAEEKKADPIAAEAVSAKAAGAPSVNGTEAAKDVPEGTAAAETASGETGKYEAYGIGQELPVYLM